MPASSNFREAIRDAQSSALVGPNVVNRALPYVGGGMVLTSVGVLGGIASLGTLGAAAFQGLSLVAIIPWLILFFVAQNAANKANNSTALPLLATFSLLTGFTLTGLILQAVAVAGAASIGIAALATGITFVIASIFGRRMSESVGQALSAVVGLGMFGLLIAMVGVFIASIFVGPSIFAGTSLLIAGFGTVLFIGMAFVDFYTMPRTYNDDQYLAGALGMYLTFINLFIFILRLIISLNGGSRRD
ncbi:MAG: US12 family protein [Synechococcus sp. SupBloom_Metag_053]|jgi:hypothetical protein|nr:US12 family protein [Synechococcus sp. SupBloom_Metag_053]